MAKEELIKDLNERLQNLIALDKTNILREDLGNDLRFDEAAEILNSAQKYAKIIIESNLYSLPEKKLDDLSNKTQNLLNDFVIFNNFKLADHTHPLTQKQAFIDQLKKTYGNWFQDYFISLETKSYINDAVVKEFKNFINDQSISFDGHREKTNELIGTLEKITSEALDRQEKNNEIFQRLSEASLKTGVYQNNIFFKKTKEKHEVFSWGWLIASIVFALFSGLVGVELLSPEPKILLFIPHLEPKTVQELVYYSSTKFFILFILLYITLQFFKIIEPTSTMSW
ncbi:MAG: hypothetical protein U0003_03055 [Vampirovibrionales bacterium]